MKIVNLREEAAKVNEMAETLGEAATKANEASARITAITSKIENSLSPPKVRSTAVRIAVEDANGEVRSIHCEYGGIDAINKIGGILLMAFDDYKSVDSLIKCGDIGMLVCNHYDAQDADALTHWFSGDKAVQTTKPPEDYVKCYGAGEVQFIADNIFQRRITNFVFLNEQHLPDDQLQWHVSLKGYDGLVPLDKVIEVLKHKVEVWS